MLEDTIPSIGVQEIKGQTSPTSTSANDNSDVLKAEVILSSKQAEALLEISALLSSDLNSGRVLSKLLQYICSLFRADRAAVFLLQNLQSELTRQLPYLEEGENPPQSEISAVVCAASVGLSDRYISSMTKLYEEKEFRRLQIRREPVYVADAVDDVNLNGFRDINKNEGFRTMLTLPLMYRDSLIGSLVVYHDQRRIYSQEELRLLSVFANQASLSISNARLYEAALNREREANLLAEAGRIFNSTLRLREVLNEVVRVASTVAGNDALIYIIKEGSDLAYPVSFYSENPQSLSPLKENNAIKLGQGAVGKSLQSGIPAVLKGQPDLKVVPFLKPDLKVNGLICVPLKARRQIIGALVCYQTLPKDRKHRPLNQTQVAIFQALADRAATAIENSRMYEAEQREQRAKDEFLSFISHELRTPLTSLKGFSNILVKRITEAQYGDAESFGALIDSLRHHTKIMDGQVERLHLLIENLTSISNIETGRLNLKIRPTEVVAIIQKQVAEFEAQTRTVRLPRTSYHFEVKASPARISAAVDPMAFERIIHNILSNSIKFSPRGGHIKIKVQESLKDVVISIRDEGIGISNDEQDRIFHRFYKVSTAQGRANGLGLGLYITKGLVEAMEGHIEVESSQGSGATFIVYLKRIMPTI
jgi:signal transduction histidine kinase